MKRFYTLLFNITLISSYGVAKTGKIDAKYEASKIKSIKVTRSKLIDYSVGGGDTLYSIARKHHTTVAKIELINSLKNSSKLKIGSLLRIPVNLSVQASDKKSSNLTLASVTQKAEKEKNRPSPEIVSHKENIKKETKLASAHKVSKRKNVSIEKKEISRRKSTHKVVKGDSLYAIAKNNHTTVKVLKRVNKIKTEKNLKLGQILTIPAGSCAEKKTRVKIAEKKNKQSTKTTVPYKVLKGDSLYAIAKKNDTTVEALKKINKIKSEKNLRLGQVLKIPGSLHAGETKTKIAKVQEKKDKKTKIAKNKIKREQKIASSKKTSGRKLVIDAHSSKKSFLSRLSFGGKSSLKLSAAKKQLGKRYVWGATGPYTFDCSGFTSYVCKKSGVCIPRTSIDQSKTGKRISRHNLKPGDLVFFDTSKRHRGYVNHVGIYLGNNKFIHASSAKKRVIITSLEKPFYKSRFKWGSRVKG